MVEVGANAAAPYPFSRCAGLYQATMEWAGQKRLGEEAWDSMDTARTGLIMLSVVTAQEESGGTFEGHADKKDFRPSWTRPAKGFRPEPR